MEVLFPEGGVGNFLGIYIKLGSIFAISEMIVVILFICLCFFAAALNCLDGYWIVDKVVSLNIVFVATQRSRIKLSCNPLLQFKKKKQPKKKKRLLPLSKGNSHCVAKLSSLCVDIRSYYYSFNFIKIETNLNCKTISRTLITSFYKKLIDSLAKWLALVIVWFRVQLTTTLMSGKRRHLLGVNLKFSSLSYHDSSLSLIALETIHALTG